MQILWCLLPFKNVVNGTNSPNHSIKKIIFSINTYVLQWNNYKIPNIIPHFSSLFLTLHLGGLTLNTEEPNKIITQSISYLYHPGYNDYLNNDVGLIRMQSSIRFNENIYPIRLPTKNSYIPPGVTVRVSGWGKVNDCK